LTSTKTHGGPTHLLIACKSAKNILSVLDHWSDPRQDKLSYIFVFLKTKVTSQEKLRSTKFCTFYQFTKVQISTMADQNVGAAARATIRSQTQTAIGLKIPVFSGIKPFTINPEQWVQRVYNAIATGG
jgi:hypothetical protein